MNLLIVDDQKDVQESLSKMLAYIPSMIVESIFTADSVPAARECLRQKEIDIVLLDIAMDGEDGFCLLKTIRSQNMPVSVIMMTGYPEMSYALRAIEMHVEGFLLKPILPEKLQEVLLATVQRRVENRQTDYAARHLQCMLLDAYLQGVNMDVNFKKIAEKTGLSDIVADYLLVMQAQFSVSAQMDKRQKQLFKQLKKLFANSLCYTPKLDRMVLIAGVKENFDGLSMLDECMQSCYPGFHAGCFVGPAAHGLASLYRSAAWILEHGDSEQTRHIEALNEQQLRRLIVKTYAQRLQKVRTSREELNTTLSEMMDVCASCHLSLSDLTEDFFACGLTSRRTTDERKFSAIRMRASLIELLYQDPNTLVPEKVTTMIEYIARHYHENISLTSVANAANINYTYASMLFKQYVNSTFTEYLQRVRMQEAQRLLRTTNCYTYEVAKRVGIPNQKYFIRQFKALYGVTPQAWRNNGERMDDE